MNGGGVIAKFFAAERPTDIRGNPEWLLYSYTGSPLAAAEVTGGTGDDGSC
jgi:hypothetical protein